MKLYQICEAATGYTYCLEVYTGRENSDCIRRATTLNPRCTATTKLVVGMMEKFDLLNQGRHLYMDNYYTSPELFEELLYFHTYCTGTVRSNRTGLPAAVKDARLKHNECIFRRKDQMLCIKWCDKRMVMLLTTIHEADEVPTKRKDRHGNVVYKPTVICDYTKNMRGVDLQDQLIGNYCLNRRTFKWWRKLFFHLVQVCLHNAYVLHRKFAADKLPHQVFLLEVAQYLITSSVPTATCTVKPKSIPRHLESRFSEQHYIVRISNGTNGSKKQKKCKACTIGKRALKASGLSHMEPHSRKTNYKCEQCDMPMCITPCFKFYHTYADYPKRIMQYMGN